MSKKRNKLERELKKVKRSLPENCEICGGYATDAAHILPRSLYMEFISNPLNLMALCRPCHTRFDDDAAFRHLQTKFYKRAFKMHEQGANKYFRMNE